MAEAAIDYVVSPEGRGPPPEELELEGGPEVMQLMRYHNEGFRGKIRDSLMEREIAEVSKSSLTLFGSIFPPYLVNSTKS